jgi:hypothetical protein
MTKGQFILHRSRGTAIVGIFGSWRLYLDWRDDRWRLQFPRLMLLRP